MAHKALLMILDGWGCGSQGKGDVIFQTPTPYMDYLHANYPNFRSDLYSHYPMSENEYRICMLVKMEVTPSNMAKLLAMGNSSISQSRLRMQQKVFNGQGTARDWDAYVLSL